MNRKNSLKQLREEKFDVLIIGGGASGCGCALDSTLRGYRTAMIEKIDFASGTSSKSTKLIHGGVRYLEQAFMKFDFAQLRQVKHGLEERHTLLKNAPHLTRTLPLITPVFSWFEGLYFTIGLKIYSWFASGKDTLPDSEWLSKKAARTRLPKLTNNIHSAVLYYDGQLDDARYCLALAQSAHDAGAVVSNYTTFVDFEKNESGELLAVVARDTITGEEFRIKAKTFVNCTGPFSDKIRNKANEEMVSRIRPSKGVHIVFPDEIFPGTDALLIPETKDGRVVFAIPFDGQLILGTTDTAYQELEKEPILEKEEATYLVETLQRYLDDSIDVSKIKAGFGGLRPLIASVSETGTKSLLRDHEVEFDNKSKLVSLLGGKWTTYRVMAQDTINFVSEQLFSEERPCSTAEHLLKGAKGYHAEQWKGILAQTALPETTCRHLAETYGGEANKICSIIDQNPALREQLVAGFPYIKAEVFHAIQHEMTITIRDFMSRRIRLEILNWEAAKKAAPVVATLMGQELNWGKAKQTEQLQNYLTHLAKMDFRKT